MSEEPKRVVSDSMLGMSMPDIDRWSPRVTVVLGQNPGMFTGPGTNTYLIGTGERRLLLDTGQGVPSYIGLLERALAEAGPRTAIHDIVLTHAHGDHIGGVESICEHFGAIPVAKKPWPELDRGIELDVLDEGDVVETEGATLEALWTPGHARDHLCFYMREEKALFTGDVVLGAGTTVIPPDGDLGQYLDSLRRLLVLDLDVIYPAHGPAVREPHRKISDYLAHRKLRDRQILAGLAAGLSEIPALVRQIYSDIPEMLHAAAGVSVQAHLRKLEREGVVRREDDRWYRC